MSSSSRSDEGAKKGLIEAGLPDFIAQGVVEVFSVLREGAGEQVTEQSSR